MQVSSGGVIASLLSAAQDPVNVLPADKNIVSDEKGDQRLSLEKLRALGTVRLWYVHTFWHEYV